MFKFIILKNNNPTVCLYQEETEGDWYEACKWDENRNNLTYKMTWE